MARLESQQMSEDGKWMPMTLQGALVCAKSLNVSFKILFDKYYKTLNMNSSKMCAYTQKNTWLF
jgi:hypothetical protein